MPVPDSSTSKALSHRRPICTIASWAVPAAVGLITCIAYQVAVVRRVNGDWLPGMMEFLVGLFVTGLAAFAFGLAALLRRERNRWLALLPFLSGAGVVLYFSWIVLRNWLGSH